MYKLAISFSLILAVIGYFFYAENRIDSLQKKLENEENITKNLKKKIEVDRNVNNLLRKLKEKQREEETTIKEIPNDKIDTSIINWINKFNGM